MLQSGMGAHPGAFAPGQCLVTVGARFGTPGAESGSGVIKHVTEETGRDGERENRPGAFRPEAWTVNSSYCPLNKWPTFTPRAEGSNHNHKRRNARSGICGAGSENPKSFSALVREKKFKKGNRTDMRGELRNGRDGMAWMPACALWSLFGMERRTAESVDSLAMLYSSELSI